MKKLLIITAIFLFGFTSVKAQEEVQFGVKGGLNLSTISTDSDFISFDSKACIQFGIVAEIPISESFSFQPEILYDCLGADYEFDDIFDLPTETTKAAADYSGTIKLSYLNIPLMAKYYVAEGFSLEAGPQVGFLLSAKDEYEYPGDSGEDDIKEHVKGIDFGINIGLGYKLEGGFNFGARYNLGLTDANDNPEELGDIYLKNRAFQVFVGYFF